MYKRRARIAFQSAHGALSARVIACVRETAGAWIEPLSYHPDLSDYDLLITLDPDGPPGALPAGVRHKAWWLDPQAPREAIAAEVASLVAGMRLLARLDGTKAPGTDA